MNKEENYQKAILKHLFEEGTQTASDIAKSINLSEKSVRLYIDKLNLYLEEKDVGFIDKKRGTGNTLIIAESKEKYLKKMFDNTEFVINNSEDRVNQLLFTLLLDSKKITTTLSLSEKYYVSKPTILKDLELCKEELQIYDIDIKFSRNKGVYIKYREENYRSAVKDFLMKNWPKKRQTMSFIQDFFKGIDLTRLEHAIHKVEEKWKIQFSEKSFTELLIFLCLLVTRNINNGKNKALLRELEEELKIYNEYSFAYDLCEEVGSLYFITFSIREVEFLSHVILSFSLLHHYNVVEKKVNNIFLPISEYEQKITSFVRKLMQTMGKILNQDFLLDKKLYFGLLGHIRPAIFRMKFRNTIKDTTITFIKKEYKDVYRASWGTTTLFEEYFGIEVTENELLYLSMYFQASIERNLKKLNVLILSKLDMSQNQFIAEKIKSNIPMIDNIDVMSQLVVTDKQQYNLVLSTNQDENNTGYIQIDLPFTNNKIEILREEINETLLNVDEEILFEGECHQLFNPELIFTQCDMSNKHSLLKFLTDKLEEKGYVTKNFLECVLSREAKTSTYIENNIAIPHGSVSEVNESKMCIAILKEPIQWEDEVVEIVFLMALKMNSKQESEKVQQFYKSFVQLTSSEKNIQKMKALKNNIELYQFFMR